MRRRRLAQAALRCYPPSTRDAHGAEMLDTLLEAADDRHGVFVRDVASLVIGGLGERARASARTGIGATIAEAAKLASILSACLWLAVFSDRLGWHSDGPYTLRTVALVAVVLAWLIGRQRVAGIIGVLCTVLMVLAHRPYIPVPAAVAVVPAVGYLLMSIAPTRQRPYPVAVAALAGLVALSVTVSPESPGGISALIVLVPVSLAGVLAFPVQPRLAIAAALIWTAAGIELIGHADASAAPFTLLIASGPAVLAASVARGHLIRRRAM